MILTALSALAEPTRRAAMRILYNEGEHCVGDLMRRLAVTQSRMSPHMQVLKQVGLLVDRKVQSAGKVLAAEDIGRLL